MSEALILVVDDNEMNRDMLSRRLERQGYRAITAEDGEQALDILPAHPFDLVLLDIMMPRLNGYEVLEKIKNNPALRHTPIIMISAVDDLDSVVKCVEMGADDYLFKPFNPILLKARISASLEKKRLRDQERRFLASSGGDNRATLRRYVEECLNTGQLNKASVVSPHCRFIFSGITDIHAAQSRLSALRDAFAGLSFTLEETAAEADTVAARLTLRGIHQGSYQGIQAAGQKIQLDALAWYRFDDGLIAEERLIIDEQALLRQLNPATPPEIEAVGQDK